MPSACFDASAVSTPWKHAEGMSLRYGAVIFDDLTHILRGKIEMVEEWWGKKSLLRVGSRDLQAVRKGYYI